MGQEKRRIINSLPSILYAAGNPFATLGIAFGIGVLVILASGEDPLAAYGAMLSGAFGSMPAVCETIVKAIPLTLAGLAVALCLLSGLFNIGVEGQLLIGGLAAAWTGYMFKLPAILHIPVCIIAGIAGGALWGFLPGLLKARRGVHEVITTIMLNYIAFYLTHYLVTNQLKDPNSMAPQTPEIQPTACLGSLGGAHWGILIAVLGVCGFAFLMNHTVAGYELKVLGANQNAARASGINVPRAIILAMLLSGGLAGIAGAVEVLGVHHRFYDQFSPGYGFDSIAVALLGNNRAGGTALSALLFGALRNGAVSMQLSTETPKEIVTLIQAFVIILTGMKFLGNRYFRR